MTSAANELTSEADMLVNKGIQTYSRVAVPIKQFIMWVKNHGSAFLTILDKTIEDEEETPSKKFKNA